MKFVSAVFVAMLFGAAPSTESGSWFGAYSTDTELGRIVGNGRTYFYKGRTASDLPDDTPGCPALNARCRQRAYLIAGDWVMIGERRGGFVYASFADRQGHETDGWLPVSSIALARQGAPTPNDWRGKWHRDEADIEISSTGDGLHVEGEAVWGSHDPQRVESGAIHLGDFVSEAVPRGDQLQLRTDNGECKLRLRLLGPYLLVDDNQGCGGANVSFGGVYRRNG